MPLLGSGIVPSGAVGTELQAITRRAFIPTLVVQTYMATPVLSAALSNAQTASGGVSSCTVPVQGTNLVTAQATDYSGAFTAPAEVSGISDAEFNLKAVVVPIPFLGMEGIVQLNSAVIPKIEAKMNDAGNQIASFLAGLLATNATDQTVNIDGFPLMAAQTGTYGNINRTLSANSWWRGNVRTDSGSPTRAKVLQWIVSATAWNGGEMPNCGVMSPATWAAFAQDFVGQEQYTRTPGGAGSDAMEGRAAFTALVVAGVPIYMDANWPDGELILFNTRYFSFYIHEMAAFAFTGFASTLPNMTLGYVGAVVAVLEAICVKPKSVTRVTGFTALSGISSPNP